jgi:hypothetical protein
MITELHKGLIYRQGNRDGVLHCLEILHHKRPRRSRRGSSKVSDLKRQRIKCLRTEKDEEWVPRQAIEREAWKEESRKYRSKPQSSIASRSIISAYSKAVSFES